MPGSLGQLGLGAHPLGLAPASSTSTAPGSIPTSEAWGNPTVFGQQFLSPGSITSSEAWGSPAVFDPLQSVLSGSIASAEAWGNPTVFGDQFLSPGSITSSEAWGSPTVFNQNQFVGAGSIPSSEAWGSPTVFGQQFLGAGSISSPVAFGVPVVAGPIIATSILSAEAWGSPTLNVVQVLNPNSIASAEAWGSPTVNYSAAIIAGSIASSEAWGVPTVSGGDQLVVAGSIWSGPVFGVPTVLGGLQRLQLFIGGVPRTNKLRVGTMNLELQVKGRSSASFRLGYHGTDYKPAVGQTVRVTELGETVFSGCINEVKSARYMSTAADYTWDIAAVDKASLCDHRVVTAKFLAGSRTGDAIRYIVANFLNGEGILSNLIGSGTELDADLEFVLATATECFDRICDITGEHWSVGMQDAELRFETFATAPAAPWGISETSKNWRNFTMTESLVDYRNVQYVRSNRAVTS